MILKDQKEQEDITSGNGCPHLGLKDDRETISAYPSHWNVCYHVSPSQTPNFLHQRTNCLTQSYADCVVYKQQANGKMPKKIQHTQEGLREKTKLVFLSLGILLSVGLIIVAFIFREFWIPGVFEPEKNLTDKPEPTITDYVFVTQTQVPGLIEIFEPQASDTPTLIPSQTASATPVTPTTTIDYPPLALDTPIGLTEKFVIHQVEEGESLLLFANWYKTSAEAIQAINLNISYPIQVGDIVIIPINRTDTTGLPAFEAYEVKGMPINIQDLSTQLGVAVEDLYFYNNVVEGQIIQPGEWLIVPREVTP
jgi:hypothetical protein